MKHKTRLQNHMDCRNTIDFTVAARHEIVVQNILSTRIDNHCSKKVNTEVIDTHKPYDRFITSILY